MDALLAMYTIYYDALDYPGMYVVRKWIVDSGPLPQPDVLIGAPVKSLDAARAQVPAGLICLPHTPGDERQIVETWF